MNQIVSCLVGKNVDESNDENSDDDNDEEADEDKNNTAKPFLKKKYEAKDEDGT